jgi:hypothetical protein
MIAGFGFVPAHFGSVGASAVHQHDALRVPGDDQIMMCGMVALVFSPLAIPPVIFGHIARRWCGSAGCASLTYLQAR